MLSRGQKCDAIIRGTEYSDYTLFLSSAHSFFLSSLFQCGCLSLCLSSPLPLFLSLFIPLFQTLSAVDETLQVRWKEAQPWNLSGNKRTHRETFQPSQAVSRIEQKSDDRKRRPAETQWNKKQEAPLSFCLSSRSHFKFSLLFLLHSPLVSPPSFPILPDGSQLSNFWRLHLPRSWPCTLQLNSLYVCECM